MANSTLLPSVLAKEGGGLSASLHRAAKELSGKGWKGSHAFPSPSTKQPHQTIRSLYNVTHLALSEGLEDLGNVGGEAHVDKHHLRELTEGKRDEFASGTK